MYAISKKKIVFIALRMNSKLGKKKAGTNTGLVILS